MGHKRIYEENHSVFEAVQGAAPAGGAAERGVHAVRTAPAHHHERHTRQGRLSCRPLVHTPLLRAYADRRAHKPRYGAGRRVPQRTGRRGLLYRSARDGVQPRQQYELRGVQFHWHLRAPQPCDARYRQPFMGRVDALRQRRDDTGAVSRWNAIFPASSSCSCWLRPCCFSAACCWPCARTRCSR